MKLRTARTVPGLIALAVALTALIGIVEAVTAGTGRGMAVPVLRTAAGLRDVLSSAGFALLVAAVLGTMVTAGEFRMKTATGTYLDEPRRSRVLAAKALASAAAGAAVGLAVAVTATGIGLGFTIANGYALPLTGDTIASLEAGTVIGAALLAAAGAGVGSLIRHQVGAIIAVFAWGLVVELIVGSTATAVAPYLPYTEAAMLAGDTNGGGMPQIPRGAVALPFPAALILLAAVAALICLAAALTTVRRDVT